MTIDKIIKKIGTGILLTSLVSGCSSNSPVTQTGSISSMYQTPQKTSDSSNRYEKDLCIIVKKSNYSLKVFETTNSSCDYREKNPIMQSPVIIGGEARDFITDELKEFETPTGTYYISMMGGTSQNPAKWIDPKDGTSKEGPFGNYWFPLQKEPIQTQNPKVSPPSYSLYALHGPTQASERAFKNKSYRHVGSRGCVRVKKEDELKETILRYTQSQNEEPTNIPLRGPVRNLDDLIEVRIKE